MHRYTFSLDHMHCFINETGDDYKDQLMLHLKLGSNGGVLLSVNIPALSMAPLMAMEPSLVAGSAARLLLKEPIGVRTALTITTS